MHLDGSVLVGEATAGMVLVFNRTDTPKQVTVDGHMLGGKEKAWVTKNDEVLLNGISSGVIRIVWDGKVSEDEKPHMPEEVLGQSPKPKRGRPKKSANN